MHPARRGRIKAADSATGVQAPSYNARSCITRSCIALVLAWAALASLKVFLVEIYPLASVAAPLWWTTWTLYELFTAPGLPPYDLPTRSPGRAGAFQRQLAGVPVVVISLPGAGDARRAVLEVSLQSQAVDFGVMPAVDGLRAYAGTGDEGVLRRRLWAPHALNVAPGVLGCGLSHLVAWERAVEASAAITVILEDDAVAKPDLEPDLADALRGLPSEWDVLYLTTCEHMWGATDHGWGIRVSSRARHVRLATCTVGYAVSARGARRLLASLAGSIALPVDLAITRLLKAGRLRAYAADPPLVTWQPAASGASTVNSNDSVHVAQRDGLGRGGSASLEQARSAGSRRMNPMDSGGGETCIIAGFISHLDRRPPGNSACGPSRTS